MKNAVTCSKCRKAYDTNTQYGGCPYCLRKSIKPEAPKVVRDREQKAWNAIAGIAN